MLACVGLFFLLNLGWQAQQNELAERPAVFAQAHGQITRIGKPTAYQKPKRPEIFYEVKADYTYRIQGQDYARSYSIVLNVRSANVAQQQAQVRSQWFQQPGSLPLWYRPGRPDYATPRAPRGIHLFGFVFGFVLTLSASLVLVANFRWLLKRKSYSLR